MELYKQYLKEIADINLVYGDDFFYTYQIQDNTVYLENVYIEEKLRRSGKIQEIFEDIFDICRKEEKKFATSTVCKNASKKTIERSSHILKRNGFEIFEEDDNMLYFSKEIL